MSDSDKHEAIKDLRERMLRVEGAVSNVGIQVATSIAAVSKEVSGFIHEIDRRALEAKNDESEWKSQHAAAVTNCNAKGEIAQEAKRIALSAKATAEKAYQAATGAAPASHKRTDRIAWAGFVGAITTLLGILATYLKAHL